MHPIQHNRMGLSGDVAADWRASVLRVRPRQHRRPLAVSRTDGAEQIGVVIALIGRLAGARALSRPQARQAILLAKACFVLEPDLHRRSRWQVSYMHLERVGEVFFKRRLIMWEKSPSFCEPPSTTLGNIARGPLHGVSLMRPLHVNAGLKLLHSPERKYLSLTVRRPSGEPAVSDQSVDQFQGSEFVDQFDQFQGIFL